MNRRRCRKFLVTTGCVELVVVSYDSTTIHMESTKRAQPQLDTLENLSLSFVPRETRNVSFLNTLNTSPRNHDVRAVSIPNFIEIQSSRELDDPFKVQGLFAL